MSSSATQHPEVPVGIIIDFDDFDPIETTRNVPNYEIFDVEFLALKLNDDPQPSTSNTSNPGEYFDDDILEALTIERRNNPSPTPSLITVKNFSNYSSPDLFFHAELDLDLDAESTCHLCGPGCNTSNCILKAKSVHFNNKKNSYKKHIKVI